MSLVTETHAGTFPSLAGGSTASPSDYLELLKPRVMSLVVFTALCGMAVAPGRIDPVTGLVSLLAIAVGAGASGALNMAYDADIDAVMQRTRNRPIPEGRVSRDQATAFGLTLALLSVLLLTIASNFLAAALLAGTIAFYALVYTVWLKRWTPQNIVIGGAAGALPPVIGYAVVTGTVTVESLLLFAVIFTWTPPHFWALALLRADDYGRAGIPMMPNVKGPGRTRLEILLYTLVLVPLAMLPWGLGMAGRPYAVVAGVTGAVMLNLAWQLYRRGDGASGDAAAKRLFGFSILYLFLLFAVLLAEHSLDLVARLGW